MSTHCGAVTGLGMVEQTVEHRGRRRAVRATMSTEADVAGGTARGVAVSLALVLTACSGNDEDRDARAACDPDACAVSCFADAGGVAACVGGECVCFRVPGDAGDEGEDSDAGDSG